MSNGAGNEKERKKERKTEMRAVQSQAFPFLLPALPGPASVDKLVDTAIIRAKS
jgi:hypothetical protein